MGLADRRFGITSSACLKVQIEPKKAIALANAGRLLRRSELMRLTSGWHFGDMPSGKPIGNPPSEIVAGFFNGVMD